MRIEHVKTYTQLHTWTGIIAGLLLYICFVAGALSIFEQPLDRWALQPEARLAPIPADKYDKLMQRVLEQYPQSGRDMTVYLPKAQPQHAPISWEIEHPETHEHTLWHATLGTNDELIVEQASVSAIGGFIDELHRTAGIPGGEGHDAIGTYVMGIVAAIYFVAIVSGLIIFLPGWFKDLFAVRRGKNRKRFWLDFHNILGISALPFHIVIAITTVAFAYHDVFYGSLRAMVYKDTPMFSRPAPHSADLDFTDIASIEQLTESIIKLEPGFKPAVLNFRGINTPRATVFIGGELSGQWIRGPYYAYAGSNPYTAEVGYTMMLPSQQDTMAKIVNGFFTLHFGGFGGSTVRWLYFLMGLSGSLLFLTSNILWIEKRQKKQKKQKKSTTIMARLTVGVAVGTLMGIVLAFLAARWLPHSDVDIGWWQKFAYYSGFLSCIAWALLQSPIRAARHQLIVLIALSTLLAFSAFNQLDRTNLEAISMGFAAVVFAISGSLLATLSWLRKREALMGTDSAWI